MHLDSLLLVLKRRMLSKLCVIFGSVSKTLAQHNQQETDSQSTDRFIYFVRLALMYQSCVEMCADLSTLECSALEYSWFSSIAY